MNDHILQALEEKFPALARHEFVSIGKRGENSVLSQDIYIRAFGGEYLRAIAGFAFAAHNRLFVYAGVFVDVPEFKVFADEVVARSIADPSYFQALTGKLEAACSDVERYAEEIKHSDFSGLSVASLKVAFDEAMEKLIHLVAFAYLLQNQEEIPQRILDHILEKRNVADKDALRARLLLKPTQETFMQREARELSQIAREIKHKELDPRHLPEEMKQAVRAHIAAYDWIRSKYLNAKEVSYEETVERIIGLTETREGPRDEREQDEREWNDLVKELALDEGELALLAAVQQQLYYKTMRKELICLFSYAAKNLFSEIARREGISHSEFISQTLDEIGSFFDRGVVNREDLAWRVNGFTLVFLEGEKTILPSQDFGPRNTPQGDVVLSGVIGNRGRARGKARVAGSVQELKELQKGEIAVIDKVSPDYVAHLRSAAGIITDGGGILSHGALTARELGIPAIVGTKIATAVLHTGDMIELDAEENKIRIM